jgi:hypothetical protein
MEFIEFIFNQLLYIIFVGLIVLFLSFTTIIDPDKIGGWIDWLIKAAVGGLFAYFVLITFLDYFGYY